MSAFSIRLVNTCWSWSASPGTSTGASGRSISSAAPASSARGRSALAQRSITGPISTGSVGRTRSSASTRLSDMRSATSRLIRPASRSITARKRSRAAGSSRAAPLSVSMKPIRAVSGVRSSWLTLATKSRRLRIASSSGVTSSKVTATPPGIPPPERRGRHPPRGLAPGLRGGVAHAARPLPAERGLDRAHERGLAQHRHVVPARQTRPEQRFGRRVDGRQPPGGIHQHHGDRHGGDDRRGCVHALGLKQVSGPPRTRRVCLTRGQPTLSD